MPENWLFSKQLLHLNFYVEMDTHAGQRSEKSFGGARADTEWGSNEAAETAAHRYAPANTSCTTELL